MPISAVLPNISFGRRGVDSRTAFVEKQHAGQDLLSTTWTTNANLFAQQANTLETNVNTKEASATASATNAATSATAANNAALRAESAVLDPTGTAYSTAVSNWRDTMMSKAEFNAVAAERRANRAGSGFDEFGKHFSSGFVNEGIYTVADRANYFTIGRAAGIGTSKTEYAISAINGVNSRISALNSAGLSEGNITLPTAPTVLPSTATLTQQQIDSGVIKHADASNSGLIVNGKFDTDTSGWTATNATLSVDTGRLKLTTTTGTTIANAKQTFTTIVGKKYIVEAYLEIGTEDQLSFAITGIVGLAAVTTTGRYTLEFTATSTSSELRMDVVAPTVTGGTAYFDNIAVFPADAISRSDLVFLESWHEDVSEKDFVYPLGNVQYLGTTGNSGTPVAGAFAGSATYSLFSDTWQADSALVGKGYVWSTLSDANKKAFVANPENNCYLDGDKVIQVRYRMRVVMGWGDSWATSVNNISSILQYDSSGVNRVQARGKIVTGIDMSGSSTYQYVSPISYVTPIGTEYGLWHGGGTAGTVTLAYEGKCFALPIALVHRRNQGAYHVVFNSNGSKLFLNTDGVTTANWYNTDQVITSIADCFDV